MMPPHAINEMTRRNVELIARLEAVNEQSRTFGERFADFVVIWVGSWTFLIIQSMLLVVWMITNAMAWWNPWDAYPFILLNLVLSFQAAFATPVILMSQNRQGRLSERRNQLDLQINLLAEQENTEQLRLLRLLCEKAGIAVNVPISKAMEEATQPDEIIRQITESAESNSAVHGSHRPVSIAMSGHVQSSVKKPV